MKESIQLRAQRKKNDEFYTTKKQVENIFNLYLKNYDFTNKVIYCPCDSERSEFVKFIKHNKDVLKYKEFIYTWDDYNTHEDLFNYADIIITNPPFSKLVKEFIPILNRCKKDFFVFGAKITIAVYYLHNNDWRFILPIEKDACLFDTPVENEKKGVPIIYITNISNVPYYNKKLKINRNNKETDVYEYSTGLKTYDRINNIPYIKDKIFSCPSTVLYEHNRYLFDIVFYRQDRFNLQFINNHNKAQGYSDNKPRYIRMVVKFKDNLNNDIFV